jgi:hypothetical protein
VFSAAGGPIGGPDGRIGAAAMMFLAAVLMLLGSRLLRQPAPR